MKKGFKKGHVPWNKGLTKETDERIKKYFSKPRSEETKEKIRLKSLGNKANLGKKFSDEHKRKISEALTGIKRSDEFKKKLSLAKTGKPNFKLRGRKFTEEHKKKLSGENNASWKGDEVGYKSLHEWVRNHKPKSEVCEKCKKKFNKLDASNISGLYKRDIKDYEWLCVSCHHKKDKLGLNFHKRNKNKWEELKNEKDK